MSVPEIKEELLKKELDQAEKDKMEQEQTRQRDLVKNVFWPFLLDKSTSIMDAKNIVMSTNNLLEAAFHAQVAEAQRALSVALLTEIKVEGVMKDGTDYEREKALFEMFKNENTATTNALLTGMFKAIESFEREEAAGRKLDTLKATFL